jgi:hypothetical protein
MKIRKLSVWKVCELSTLIINFLYIALLNYQGYIVKKITEMKKINLVDLLSKENFKFGFGLYQKEISFEYDNLVVKFEFGLNRKIMISKLSEEERRVKALFPENLLESFFKEVCKLIVNDKVVLTFLNSKFTSIEAEFGSAEDHLDDVKKIVEKYFVL